MKKRIIILLLVIILFIVSCNQENFTGNVVDETEIIKVGVLTPLTGPAVIYGENVKRGIDLALEEINANGGIEGRQIKLYYEDTMCDPKKGVSAYEKLRSTVDPDIYIGTVCSSVTLTLGSLFEQSGDVLISAGASNSKISNYESVFRVWPSDALQGNYLGKIVREQFNYDTVAFLYLNDDYGVGLKDSFAEKFSSLGGSVVLEEAIPEGASDVRSQLIKIKSLNPDVVFLPLWSKEIGLVLKTAKELGMNTQFISGEGSHENSVIEIGGKGAEGLIGTVVAVEETSRREEFSKNFLDKYGEDFSILSDAAYDILYVFKYATTDCDDSLKACLGSMEPIALASGTVSFDSNGDLADKTYDLFTVKDGKFVDYN